MNRVVATIRVGPNPDSVAVGEGGVWVSVRGPEVSGPDQFERTFVIGDGGTFGLEPARPGRECGPTLPVRDCIVFRSAPLVAADGTKAKWLVASHERRVVGGSVECDAAIYKGPLTSNVRDNPGRAILVIDGWGTIVSTFVRSVKVFDSLLAHFPPICAEQPGTWTGVSGRLAGERGVWEISGDSSVLALRDLSR